MSDDQVMAATPHAELIAELMNPNNPKNEREHAAVREIERLCETRQAIIAGALFDFMGWLTSRKERIVLSSADEASPAVDAIRDFAKMRGLSLDDAKVQDWNTSPQRQLESTTDMMMELADRLGELPDDIDPRAWEHLLVYAPQRHPLTDAQIWQLVNDCSFNRDLHADKFARAIEAAHGIEGEA
jgi:hypothetical protein